MGRSLLAAALPWAICALLTIGGYQLLLAQGRSPLNLVFIVALLGILAGTSLIGPSASAISLLTLGLLVAWQLPIGWLLSALPSDLARAGHDLGWIGALTTLIVAVVMAMWRRPPTRGSAGTVLESRLVNWISLLSAVGGPLIGWVVFLEFDRGDIYMRPAVIGLAVGVCGLLLFSAYSASYAIIGRPRAAAILAVAYPFLLLLAFQAPRMFVPGRSAPVVEDVAADGRLLRAFGASPNGMPANAVDGRVDTAWNAGGAAPAWIEIDLGEPSTITAISLLVAQFPDGETTHQVVGIDATGREATLAEFRGPTREGQWLNATLTQSVTGVRTVRVITLASPSWVSWREIEFVVNGP